MAGEGVDQAIDRLERQRLCLVAAAAQHQHLLLIATDVVEEGAHHPALAHARLAAHVDQDRLAFERCAPGLVEELDLALAADQDLVAGADGAEGDVLASGGELAAQSAQDVGAGGAAVGIAAQELGAQLVEIGGHIGDHLRRARGLEALLLHQHVLATAEERHTPG